MSARYRVRPAIRNDLKTCVGYIARDNLDAAIRFRHAAKETFEAVARDPRLYPYHRATRSKAHGPRLADTDRPGFQEVPGLFSRG